MKSSRQLAAILVMAFLTLFAGMATAVASLRVNVMPSGVTSPINSWDSGPYATPGAALELWGNVKYDGALPLTYTWNFGAGEGSTSGAVGNVNNIAATHTYGSTGSFVATLTVTDGIESDTDTVFIDVVPQTLDTQVNLAVQRALKYLYMTASSTTTNDCPANYWYGTSSRAHANTALAVLAFEDHGHRQSNDVDRDIYAETVKRGLNYVFYYLRTTGASMDNTTYTDSDINGNAKKIYSGWTNSMYEQGILTMAIANTATPAETVDSCGYASLQGMTYQEVLEDMVDYIAYAQKEGTSGAAGGWRYGPNYYNSDNSVTQWPILGLIAAEGAPWNISAPQWVKDRAKIWLAYDQNTSGGYGYHYSTYWVNIAKTGAGVIGIVYSGGGGNLTNALNYIGTNWNTTTYDYGNKGDHYAMYAVKKGLQYAGITTVGGHDWQAEYNQWYVTNQANAGTNGVYWPSSVRISGGQSTATFAALVMAPGLVELPPQADAGVDQEVSPSDPVSFDGTGSTHTDPNRRIVSYEWDFNYDGITFDVDATGATPTNGAGYAITNGTDTQDYTVALRVTDDNTPPLTNLDTAIVTVNNGNVAPVANPGGPYLGAVGEDITLDGSGSYDDNAAGGPNPVANPATASGFDEIVSYKWDLDGDGLFGSEDSPADPEGVAPVVNFGTFMGTKTIGLKVTDSFGRSAAQSSGVTTVAVSDLYPIGYTLQYRYYNRRAHMWIVSYKMSMRNDGNAAATDVSAKWTGSSIPAGVIVIDDQVSWSGAIGAGATVQSDDGFAYAYRSSVDPSVITWDIEFTDNLGTRHVIRNVPQ